MSPRAACRLATLGFEHPYDYMPGKVDWLARALPCEGEKANESRVIDLARDDVITCRLTDPTGAVRDRVDASPYGFAFVLSDGGVLLGRLRKATLEGAPESLAEEVMEPGPSTVRADTAPAELLDRLVRRELTGAVVTDPEGHLMGLVRRDDLQTHVGE